MGSLADSTANPKPGIETGRPHAIHLAVAFTDKRSGQRVDLSNRLPSQATRKADIEDATQATGGGRRVGAQSRRRGRRRGDHARVAEAVMSATTWAVSPGWRVWPVGNDPIHGLLIQDTDGRDVAMVACPEETIREGEALKTIVHTDVLLARAHLIAAAPELLAALKGVVAGFEANAFCRNTEGDHDPAWVVKFLPYLKALADATVAIAKAEAR